MGTLRKLGWVVLVLGLAANTLVIGVNGWKMPYRPTQHDRSSDWKHKPQAPGQHILVLSDNIAWPLGQVSWGDLLMATGLVIMVSRRGVVT